MVTVSGTVEESGTLIDGAVVEFISQTNQDVYRATTDSNGDWSADVPADTYHFAVRYEDGEGKKRSYSKPSLEVI